jgi:class 3 adenylate cyclase
MNLDLAQMTMTEIIRLQTLLSQELRQRFEARMALAFTDVVGSTEYFERFGDEAGRQLQQLHLDLLAACLPAHGGRIVDTAGDGAFACFAEPASVITAMVALLNDISAANEHRSREQQFAVRIGLHWGRVLTDGVLVTGDAVNLCSRIAAWAAPGEIHLSRDLFQELDTEHRLLCRRLPTATFKGVAREVELLRLEWRDPMRFPNEILVEQTGQRIALPPRDIVSLGRLEAIEGAVANDIVLALPDEAATRRISRWHCELRRSASGYLLRAVSSQGTTVDGVPIAQGQATAIVPGSRVELAGVMTLRFLASRMSDSVSEKTSIARNRLSAD